MREVLDQMHTVIRLETPPRRIVSLVPSQTELLSDLGLVNEVVGITKFCIYPEAWYRSKTRIGGTKSVNIEQVKYLQPDLIIGNKEENSEKDIYELRKIAPVWMSDIYTLTDALDMISSLGDLCDRVEQSTALCTEIMSEFKELNSQLSPSHPMKTVAYYIWKDPNMLAGKHTFIDAMLQACGWVNITTESRYPEENPTMQPDVIFLSTEPFPFNEEHCEEFRVRFPHAQVVLVDGEFFSWYGSRLRTAPKYFTSLLEQLTR
ncbi:MAG: cobalamin-binding protein [Bacteroidetes bacterium RIFCSPHIGHO2_02_FULL_44_7]|nr:MAG: cobalamin-binding protein [Bacteroidetes bacterium RIFCSPHIGHO2_02_FULL_44_7]